MTCILFSPVYTTRYMIYVHYYSCSYLNTPYLTEFLIQSTAIKVRPQGIH